MLWRKVDAAERARFGTAGELALVELLRADTEARVEHVAAESDSFGFDIAVETETLSALLEVKTTRRRARLSLYLSRNEFETMQREPTWHLVLILLDEKLAISAIRTIPNEWISQGPGKVVR